MGVALSKDSRLAPRRPGLPGVIVETVLQLDRDCLSEGLRLPNRGIATALQKSPSPKTVGSLLDVQAFQVLS